ncbi:MAG: hypothetical protein ACI92O_000339 [Colwellia sp.]|jgi:hypothetical protein
MKLWSAIKLKISNLFTKNKAPVEVEIEIKTLEISFPISITGVQVKKEVSLPVLTDKMRGYLTDTKN